MTKWLLKIAINFIAKKAPNYIYDFFEAYFVEIMVFVGFGFLGLWLIGFFN